MKTVPSGKLDFCLYGALAVNGTAGVGIGTSPGNGGRLGREGRAALVLPPLFGLELVILVVNPGRFAVGLLSFEVVASGLLVGGGGFFESEEGCEVGAGGAGFGLSELVAACFAAGAFEVTGVSGESSGDDGEVSCANP